jgi:8-oxo-dGTP pyrophosphatase MutT (NUDIX family)
VNLPVPLCRVVYRSAYTALRGYWFVRRPDVQGVKCVLTDGDRVLLVRHTYGHREWDLPGGAVRRDEPPAQTAVREMHEELGVRVDGWRKVGELREVIDHRRDTMHCFTADISGLPITMDRCELQAVSWFHRDSLPRELGRFVTRILAMVETA